MKLTKTHFFILSLTSAWATGVGLRFILMGTQNTYELNTLDLIFDWAPLLILGISLLLLTAYLYLGEKNEHCKEMEK